MSITEFKSLDIPGLRITRCEQAPLVKAQLGLGFMEPTKVMLTEGNRRVIKDWGDPALLEGTRIVQRSGDTGAVWVNLYNTVLMRPGVSGDVDLELHEVGHSVHGHLELQVHGYLLSGGLHPHDIERVDLNLGERSKVDQFFSEGIAEWIKMETILRRVGLRGRDLIEAHFDYVDYKTKKMSEDAYLRKLLGPYGLGHFFMQIAMVTLTNDLGLTVEESLKLLVKSPPDTISQMSRANSRREYLAVLISK